MSDEEKEQKGFVVNDRRRFDASGNEKSEPSKPVEPVKAKEIKPETQSATTMPDESAQHSNDHGEMNFSSFIMSLATQALMQLGEIQPPPGINLEIDKAAARQSIDILGMLEQKTKNNLDKEEAHLLEQILHNLRLSYVKAVS